MRPLICYDLRFPVWSRDAQDTDLLLYTANWPGARRQHWNRLLPARAIENLCYVAAVNRIGTDGKGFAYTGDSQVLDFQGETLLSAGGGGWCVSRPCWKLPILQAYRSVSRRIWMPIPSSSPEMQLTRLSAGSSQLRCDTDVQSCGGAARMGIRHLTLANKRPRGSHSGAFCISAEAYAAFASGWLNERFSALNSALKLAVVMFSSIPTPCTARSPFTRSSM